MPKASNQMERLKKGELAMEVVVALLLLRNRTAAVVVRMATVDWDDFSATKIAVVAFASPLAIPQCQTFAQSSGSAMMSIFVVESQRAAASSNVAEEEEEEETMPD